MLLNREYVYLDNWRFRPSDVGRTVAKFLSAISPATSTTTSPPGLGDELDAVSRGEEEWVPLLRRFLDALEATGGGQERVGGGPLRRRRGAGSSHQSGQQQTGVGAPGPLRALRTDRQQGRRRPRFASLRGGQSMHTITPGRGRGLFNCRALGHGRGGDVSVGVGRFGPFVKQGDTYASFKPTDDPYTIELDRALELVRENANWRQTASSATSATAYQVLNGRYGPVHHRWREERAHSHAGASRPPSVTPSAWNCSPPLPGKNRPRPIWRGEAAPAAKKSATKRNAAEVDADKPAPKKAPARKGDGKETGRRASGDPQGQREEGHDAAQFRSEVMAATPLAVLLRNQPSTPHRHVRMTCPSLSLPREWRIRLTDVAGLPGCDQQVPTSASCSF